MRCPKCGNLLVGGGSAVHCPLCNPEASQPLSLNDLRLSWKLLNEACAELLAENAALKEQLARHQWRPIKTAPKDGTEILIGSSISRSCGIGHYAKHYDTLIYRNPIGCVTHWMPLPEPPEADNAD